ncbi:MAG: AraC family transcriptional regulator [Prevotella sp.]|nr:AraC family transcriptional regulator [Prevotella sp.]
MNYRISYIFSLLSIFILLSCGHKTTKNIFDEAHRNIFDSIADAQKEPEALLALIDNYNKSGEQMGEMIMSRQLGKIYRDRSNFNQAITYHRRSANLATFLADTIEMVKALNNVGTDYRRLGIYDIAAQYHYNALQLCMQYSDKKTEQAKKNRVISLNGLGNVYLTLGNIQQADSVLRQALAGEHELNSSLGQAINYANIGSIFEDKQLIDSAWIYYRLSMQKNVQAQSDLGVALCYTHYGRLYEKQHNYKDAIIQYQTAYNLMQKKDDKWHALEALLPLANIYILQNNLSAAQEFLNKALPIANDIQSKEHLQRIQLLYYNIYKQKGDTLNALNAFVKAKEYQDSIVNIKTLNDVQNMRINIERQRKQDELQLIKNNLQLERKAKKTAYIALFAVICAAFLSIVLIYSILHNRTRKQLTNNNAFPITEDQESTPSISNPPINSHLQETETKLSSQDQQFINKLNDSVFALIRQNKLDTTTLANIFRISTTQLNRKINNITGYNTITYITQLRMNYAKRLLDSKQDLSISDIASKCGYDDTAYFCRIFKQTTQMTPSQYRKRIT